MASLSREENVAVTSEPDTPPVATGDISTRFVEAPQVYPVSCGYVEPGVSGVKALGWGEIRSSNGHGAVPVEGLTATRAHVYELELSGEGGKGGFHSADFYIHVPTDRHEVAGERIVPPKETQGVVIRVGLQERGTVRVQHFSREASGEMRIDDFSVPRRDRAQFSKQEALTLVGLRNEIEGRRDEFVEPLSVAYGMTEEQAIQALDSMVSKLNGRIGELNRGAEA